jgi:hypothetical protein
VPVDERRRAAMTSDAEVAALRIIVSNVVGQLAATQDDGGRALLSDMAHQCKLAAEHTTFLGTDRARLVIETQTYVDEFFKGITVTPRR